MPLTTASAYFCWPSGVFISAESAGFFMLPSSTRIDGYCARFSPAMSARGIEAVGADVVGRRECPTPASWSRMVWANCTDGPACTWFSGGDE